MRLIIPITTRTSINVKHLLIIHILFSNIDRKKAICFPPVYTTSRAKPITAIRNSS
jgi:hypothetical protein